MSTKLSQSQASAAALIQQARMAPGVPTLWLPISYVMAHIDIESGFVADIKGSDYKTTGSIGLMQVESATVADMARQFPAAKLELPQTDPYTSILTGMLYLYACKEYLLPIFGAPLAYQHICMAYNEGMGACGEGFRDTAYWYKWISAQKTFAFLDLPSPTV